MNTEIIHHAEKAAETAPGIKTTLSVIITTMSIGFSTWVGWIEAHSQFFGAMASIGALVLSVVMVYVHIARVNIEKRRLELDERNSKKEEK